MAFSVGSEERVNELTKVIKDAGYPLLNGPRFTGDGYYESVIGDRRQSNRNYDLTYPFPPPPYFSTD